jgi:integrase
MATFRKRNRRWQARVRRHGFPDQVKTFTSKTEAEHWARAVEGDMDRRHFLDRTVAERTLLAQVLLRYASDVSPTKRGGQVEQRRLQYIARQRLAKLSLAALRPQDVADYRDMRLKALKASTANRELQLLGAVIAHAMREWGVAIPANPVSHIRLPPPGQGRSRVFEGDEEARLLAALDGAGYTRVPRLHHNPWIKPIVELALETACRRGEILGMRWEHVDRERRVVRLPLTKNGDARVVPLSTRALEIVEALPRSIDGRLFPIRWTALHQAFVKACRRAELHDFHFHDLRHVATTRLAAKLPNVV